MRPQFACGVTSKSEKEPGEIREDFRGDRREPVVGHVQPPKDRALGLFCGDTEKVSGKSERFNFFSKIKHFSIPGADIMRRPIYTSAITFYKIKDFFNLN